MLAILTKYVKIEVDWNATDILAISPSLIFINSFCDPSCSHHLAHRASTVYRAERSPNNHRGSLIESPTFVVPPGLFQFLFLEFYCYLVLWLVYSRLLSKLKILRTWNPSSIDTTRLKRFLNRSLTLAVNNIADKQAALLYYAREEAIEVYKLFKLPWSAPRCGFSRCYWWIDPFFDRSHADGIRRLYCGGPTADVSFYCP